MEFDKKQVLHLADLAKLEIKDEELESYKQKLQDILAYVEKVNTLDLENIKESISGIEDEGIGPRPDVIGDSNLKSIDQACKKEDDYVVVPNVFNK